MVGGKQKPSDKAGGVSDNISPRDIMTGIQFDYNKHCQLPFGSYVHVHEEPSPTNTQVNQLITADSQTEMLTFFYRKGLLIGDSEILGVPDPVVSPPHDNICGF